MFAVCPVDRMWGNVSAVQEVFGRCDALCVERIMDAGQDIPVLDGRWCGHHVDNHVRAVAITGFGLMILVADPFGLAQLAGNRACGSCGDTISLPDQATVAASWSSREEALRSFPSRAVLALLVLACRQHNCPLWS